MHIRKVKLQIFGIIWLGIWIEPDALRLCVGFNKIDLVLIASCQTHVVDRRLIDRKHRDGRAVFRAHIANGRAVSKRHLANARSVELHELADDAVLTQLLGDG